MRLKFDMTVIDSCTCVACERTLPRGSFVYLAPRTGKLGFTLVCQPCAAPWLLAAIDAENVALMAEQAS